MQKYFTVVLLALSVVFIVPSCSSGKKDDQKQEQAKEEYQCPMKCEGLKYDKPGKCTVCGMDLEKVNPS